MIEKLIDLYYTDEWAEIAPQGIYPLLCKCLQEARNCIPPTLWELLHKSWFHDTYVLELTCTQSKGKHVVRLTTRRMRQSSARLSWNSQTFRFSKPEAILLMRKRAFHSLPMESYFFNDYYGPSAEYRWHAGPKLLFEGFNVFELLSYADAYNNAMPDRFSLTEEE